jgi:hypothetical protein
MVTALLAVVVALVVARLLAMLLSRRRRRLTPPVRIDERVIGESLRSARSEIEAFRDLERRFYLPGEEGDEESDLEEGESTAVFAEAGFPTFEHNQYTIEGEIERFHHFGMAGARATGWKRVVALVIVVSFVAPLLLSAGWVLVRAL